MSFASEAGVKKPAKRVRKLIFCMDALTEVLPRTGAVLVEKGPLTEVLCKPKLLPIKSAALEKAEAIAKAAEDALAAAAAQKR